MNKPFAQKIHEEDVDSYKKWLCDTRPIKVQEGLDDILSHNNPSSLLKEIQIRQLGIKLTRNMRFARSAIRDKDGVVKLDDIVTLISNFNSPGRLDDLILGLALNL